MTAALTPLFAAVGDSATGENFASFDVAPWAWIALVGVIVTLLIVDLLLVHRTAHVITIKEAAIESAVWISLGLAFGLVVIAWQGGQAGGEYYAGFLIEKSLSIDNVFVWAVIFSFFAVPREYQFRVLFWGIFGALVLRGIFIVAGVSLIERFEWILYVFGGFLLYTAWKIAHHDESEQVDYNANIAMRLVRRIVPTTDRYDGQKLFSKQNAKRVATPLFAVLVLIEATDVVFAVDSVPAILAVSREPFIVFAANAFAILGLRSLYFLLGGMQGKFRYLNVGLGVILAFVGVKMLLIGEPFEVHLPTYASLAVIAAVITAAIVASIRADARDDSAGIPSADDLPIADATTADDPGGAEWIKTVVGARCKNAELCLDPFHIVQWATKALDEVRREVWNAARRNGQKTVARDLKHARYALWKNPEDLTARQGAKLALIAKTNERLYRAYLLKEQLRQVFALKGAAGIALLDAWLKWARRCRIPSFVKLAKAITEHRAGIEAALTHGLSNARVESVNTKLRLLTRIAFGFRSPDALIALAMLDLGGLCPPLPGRATA